MCKRLFQNNFDFLKHKTRYWAVSKITKLLINLVFTKIFFRIILMIILVIWKKKTWGTLNYTCNPVRSLSELINQASCGSVFTVHFVNLISNVVFFFRINLAITLAVTTRGSEGELNARHFVSVWGSVWKLMLSIKKVVPIVSITINIKHVGKIIH